MGSYRYTLHAEDLTHYSAMKLCQSMGGAIATVESQSELDAAIVPLMFELKNRFTFNGAMAWSGYIRYGFDTITHYVDCCCPGLGSQHVGVALL